MRKSHERFARKLFVHLSKLICGHSCEYCQAGYSVVLSLSEAPAYAAAIAVALRSGRNDVLAIQPRKDPRAAALEGTCALWNFDTSVWSWLVALVKNCKFVGLSNYVFLHFSMECLVATGEEASKGLFPFRAGVNPAAGPWRHKRVLCHFLRFARMVTPSSLRLFQLENIAVAYVWVYTRLSWQVRCWPF